MMPDADRFDTVERSRALAQILGALENYRIHPTSLTRIDDIGAGGYAQVYRATWSRGGMMEADQRGRSMLDVAVKEILPKQHKSTRLALRFGRELRLWSTLDHPHILKFLGFHVDLDQRTLYFVAPYLEGGSVRQRLNTSTVSTDERIRWVVNMTDGLHYLHCVNPPIVHGDLKADNLLVSGFGAVLCDFGLSAVMEDSLSTGLTTSEGFKGSTRWCSPELFHNESRTTASDVWAWSLTTLEIMTGRIPFESQKNDVAVMMRVVNSKILPSCDEYPELPKHDRLWTPIYACLKVEPSDRARIQHCWTAIFNVETLQNPHFPVPETPAQRLTQPPTPFLSFSQHVGHVKTPTVQTRPPDPRALAAPAKLRADTTVPMYLNAVAAANTAALSVSSRTLTSQTNGLYYGPSGQPAAGTTSSSIHAGVGSTTSSLGLQPPFAFNGGTYATGSSMTLPAINPLFSPAELGSSSSSAAHLTDNSTGAPVFQAPRLYHPSQPSAPSTSVSLTTSYSPSHAPGRRSSTFSSATPSVQHGSVSISNGLDDAVSVVSGGRHANRAGQPGTSGSEPNSVHTSSTSPGPSLSRSAAPSLHDPHTIHIRRTPFTPAWTVPPRVLLVENDPVSQTLFSKFLQVCGCTIGTAVDGIEAVNKLNLEKWDLVLMDIVMPKLDGVSVTSLIRQFDGTTPVIAMTNNSKPSDVVTYYSSGMNDILPKPFTSVGLFSMLEKHLMHLKRTSQTLKPRALDEDAEFPTEDSYAGMLADALRLSGFGPHALDAFGDLAPTVNIMKPNTGTSKRPRAAMDDEQDAKRGRFEVVE